MPDADQIKGKAKEMAGKIEQGVGRAVGDNERVASGEMHETEGKAQGTIGKVKDKAKDIID